MKYIVYDEVKNGDIFTEEFETAAEAIKRAKYLWSMLTDYDKRRRNAFCVLKLWDPDNPDTLDGDRVWSVKWGKRNGRSIEYDTHERDRGY